MSSSDYSYDEQVRLPFLPISLLCRILLATSLAIRLGRVGWELSGLYDDDANRDVSRLFRASSSLSSS